MSNEVQVMVMTATQAKWLGVFLGIGFGVGLMMCALMLGIANAAMRLIAKLFSKRPTTTAEGD